MAEDNVIDFKTRRRPSGQPGNSGTLLGPPPPPKLPQDNYRFTLLDKVNGGERIVEKSGHLVVTQHNIVLFNETQEMTWGIPNDGAVIEFEMLPREKSPEEENMELPFLDIGEAFSEFDENEPA